jgi:dTDP-4-amino-4,6-dideoxygalactose transaminase
MDRLMALARRHGFTVIEDCAHAIETEWRGRAAGTFGAFGCFSFYATKNLATGEGGMILTDDEEAAGRLKVLALHGMSKDAWKRFSDEGYRHYQVIEAGFKYNMMDLQAAIGIHQLERIEANWVRRQALWKRYQRDFAGLGLQLPADPEPGTRHGLHLFTLLVDEATTGVARDEFLESMTRHGIGVGVHYLSIPEHPYYRERFGWLPEMFPAAAAIGRRTVSLPFSARIDERDAADVVEAVRRTLAKS